MFLLGKTLIDRGYSAEGFGRVFAVSTAIIKEKGRVSVVYAEEVGFLPRLQISPHEQTRLADVGEIHPVSPMTFIRQRALRSVTYKRLRLGIYTHVQYGFVSTNLKCPVKNVAKARVSAMKSKRRCRCRRLHQRASFIYII